VFTVVTETLSLQIKMEDDVMLLKLQSRKSGFVANIAIHDAAGFKTSISQEQLLSTQGIVLGMVQILR
jgi:hypothetical protein